MSSLCTGLLVLHGHIHDPELVRRLAATRCAPPPERPRGKRRRMRSPFAALQRRVSVCVARAAGRRAMD